MTSGRSENDIGKTPIRLTLGIRVRDLQDRCMKGQKALKEYSERSIGHRAAQSQKGRDGYADPKAVRSAAEDFRNCSTQRIYNDAKARCPKHNGSRRR